MLGNHASLKNCNTNETSTEVKWDSARFILSILEGINDLRIKARDEPQSLLNSDIDMSQFILAIMLIGENFKNLTELNVSTGRNQAESRNIYSVFRNEIAHAVDINLLLDMTENTLHIFFDGCQRIKKVCSKIIEGDASKLFQINDKDNLTFSGDFSLPQKNQRSRDSLFMIQRLFNRLKFNKYKKKKESFTEHFSKPENKSVLFLAILIISENLQRLPYHYVLKNAKVLYRFYDHTLRKHRLYGYRNLIAHQKEFNILLNLELDYNIIYDFFKQLSVAVKIIIDAERNQGVITDTIYNELYPVSQPIQVVSVDSTIRLSRKNNVSDFPSKSSDSRKKPIVDPTSVKPTDDEMLDAAIAEAKLSRESALQNDDNYQILLTKLDSISNLIKEDRELFIECYQNLAQECSSKSPKRKKMILQDFFMSWSETATSSEPPLSHYIPIYILTLFGFDPNQEIIIKDCNLQKRAGRQGISYSKFSPLKVCLAICKYNIAQVLLREFNVDPNTIVSDEGNDRITALMLVVIDGEFEACACLLDANADLTAADGRGLNAVQLSIIWAMLASDKIEARENILISMLYHAKEHGTFEQGRTIDVISFFLNYMYLQHNSMDSRSNTTPFSQAFDLNNFSPERFIRLFGRLLALLEPDEMTILGNAIKNIEPAVLESFDESIQDFLKQFVFYTMTEVPTLHRAIFCNQYDKVVELVVAKQKWKKCCNDLYVTKCSQGFTARKLAKNSPHVYPIIKKFIDYAIDTVRTSKCHFFAFIGQVNPLRKKLKPAIMAEPQRAMQTMTPPRHGYSAIKSDLEKRNKKNESPLGVAKRMYAQGMPTPMTHYDALYYFNSIEQQIKDPNPEKTYNQKLQSMHRMFKEHRDGFVPEAQGMVDGLQSYLEYQLKFEDLHPIPTDLSIN